MARPKKKATNYCCQIKDKDGNKCGAVLGSLQALHGHLHHSVKKGHGNRGKGFKVLDSMFKMTTKAAQPASPSSKSYVPKKKKEEVKTKRKYAARTKPKTTPVSGVLRFPIILEVDFNFSSIRVGEHDFEPQTIKVK